MSRFLIGTILFFISVFFITAATVFAASPTGDDTFQLLVSPTTGGDNTGDGGTGNVGDYNYYYVGQTFTTTMEIKSGGTTAANIWIDYNSVTSTGSNLNTGSYFNTWSNQVVSSSARGSGLGRIYSTGSNIPVTQSNGTGSFGTVQWTMNRPSAAAYGTGSAEILDINVGTIGSTTESNISLSGADLLDDEEDFYFHIWADTIKPYALNASPATASTSVPVDWNYTFDLCDSKDGEAVDAGTCLSSGVGTGVDVTTPPGAITFDDGGGADDYTPYDSYSCSGTWGSNTCDVTVNPPSPLGIAGDQRNWEYDTSYTADISGFRDLASASQDQLGDANGPNTMDAKSWTFTTEADTTPPQVSYRNPAAGASGVSISTNVTVRVVDKKSLAGSISGTGVNAGTCRIRIYSASFASTTYQQGDGEVTVSSIDYGYQFTIDPASNFAQNETVYVSVYGCEDLATTPNTMITDNYSFTTADTDPPYVDNKSPANDASIATTGTVNFHIKDDGVGVDLSETVIYVNGTYYTDGGGAGSVTTNGTRITFSSSSDFNGGNYGGDTTSVSGGVNDYTFVIDPENLFTSGEAVIIAIYTEDTSGNIMERELYAAVVDGGVAQTCGNGSVEGNEVCDDGNTTSGDGCRNDCLSDESCGNGIYDSGEECDDGNTTSGDGCDSTCNFEGSTTQCSGGGGGVNVLGVYNPNVSQIDENTVMVTWSTNMLATGRVVYGEESAVNFGNPPNYTYTYSSDEVTDRSLFHSFIISDLEPGVMYYFRPISTTGAGVDVLGEELRMTARFATETITETITEYITEYVDRIEYVYIDEGTGDTLECPTTDICPPVLKAEDICPDYFEEMGYKEITEDKQDDTSSTDDEPGFIGITGINGKSVDPFLYEKFGIKFIEVKRTNGIKLYGTGVPNSKFTLVIY